MGFFFFFGRYIKEDFSQMKISCKEEQIRSTLLEPEDMTRKPCSEISSFKDSADEDLDEKDDSKPSFAFTFKFPSFEEFSRSHTWKNGDFDFASSSSPPSQSENQFCHGDKLSFSKEEPEVKTWSNKYDFLGGKNVSFFMEEAKVSSFPVKELYAEPNGGSSFHEEPIHSGFLSQNNFGNRVSESEGVVSNEVPLRPSIEDEPEKLKAIKGDSHSGKEQDINEDDKFLSESNYMGSDSDSESITSSHEFSFMTRFIDSTSDGFLSDTDFEGGNLESNKEKLDFDIENDPHDFDDEEEEDEDILEELRRLKESEKVSGNDYGFSTESQTEEPGAKQGSGLDDSEKPNEENPSANDCEDPNGLESLWEHQDLVEQLKMELKKVRATGLPTILEDSESPKITEDLKLWKIDERFQKGDRLSELYKFYKSYRERMRKFDILNFQKMYALGQSILTNLHLLFIYFYLLSDFSNHLCWCHMILFYFLMFFHILGLLKMSIRNIV